MATEFDWIQVGELAQGFSEHVLPDSDDLVGKSIQLFFENGTSMTYMFHDIHSLSLQQESELQGETATPLTYRATTPRTDIYLVDYLKPGNPVISESLVLDFRSGIATSIAGMLPTEEDSNTNLLSRVNEGKALTGVEVQVVSGSINKEFTTMTKKHEPTSEMIGKRVKYVYSVKDAYEHIYLNSRLYTWHCLAGVEKGLADTDRCHYFKIDTELFLFIWREKVIPTLGVALIDFHAMRSTGKIFGYESDDFGKVITFPVGARAQLANITRYE